MGPGKQRAGVTNHEWVDLAGDVTGGEAGSAGGSFACLLVFFFFFLSKFLLNPSDACNTFSWTTSVC